ncbi:MULTISPECIES: hypothetical protein [Methylobacterium]|uniref:Uncharacterized protein n=1 Tax=Methylobacterium longum TaxID=767694 RepID=A0ABT8ATI4_9HYPH|nr:MULTISPECIES: hypothetical protein [Methylobacterium]MCJ2099704.1 hypothetical protein [Methylobacterium sp. E-046]MDN3573156.1 hypothetical protein [Methylobacterium longum]GJE13677.1 hypothetical protein FOHLNKBM_4741 [Methylobacterium longum]
MTLSDLNKPADLTLWSSHDPAHTVQSRRFPTLRAALAAATQAMDTSDARPWIITDAGDILAPSWITSHRL